MITLIIEYLLFEYVGYMVAKIKNTKMRNMNFLFFTLLFISAIIIDPIIAKTGIFQMIGLYPPPTLILSIIVNTGVYLGFLGSFTIFNYRYNVRGKKHGNKSN